MPINAGPLRQIIKLEQQKGYDDSAVIGGLDRFLKNWAGKAIESITDPKVLLRFHGLKLSQPGYALLSKDKRRQWIEKVLKFLSDAEQTGEIKSVTKKAAGIKRPALKKAVKKVATEQSVDQAVTAINGISQATAARLTKLGINTIRDLCYFFPNRHLDYSQRKSISQLSAGSDETIIANIWQSRLVMLGGRRSTEAIVGDETGNIRAVWFNNPYLVKQLTTNKKVVLSGRVGLFGGRLVFESPEWEILEDKELVHTGRLVPLYPLTKGLKPRQVRKFMKEVADRWVWQIADFLPQELIKRQKFFELSEALSQSHFPESQQEKRRARTRLAFDELFLLQLGVLNQKRHWQKDRKSRPISTDKVALDAFINSLLFKLTGAQQRVLKEILADLSKTEPMCRLLQGEVGSGKTVVATAALLMAASSGLQGAFMAPTEILAEQHFTNISQLLSVTTKEETRDGYIRSYSGILSRPLTLALLTGDTKEAVKKEIQQKVKGGEIDIVIGTHAIIQKGVDFKALGLAVIDEQHRFGVEQRSALRQKGQSPHMLVMTATPIPRTLALTLYGDLDLSVIDELPPGRQVIKTKWLKPTQRESAYNFIRRQVDEGRQAFIICPLVEESEAVQAKAATAEYEQLSNEVFPSLKLGLLHGRMSSSEKEAAMRKFHSNELNIMVSTPVVEVGIDVPNATVMLIESADRFGVSQLHQFRGRVGRGQHQSYCMLLADNPSDIAQTRLDIIEKTQDGFELAEEDLKLRGPGEFFGTRQSGLPDLKMAKISDVQILELARSEATRLFEEDPELKRLEHKALLEELKRIWPAEGGEWS